MDENLPIDELELLAEEDVGEALRRVRRFYGYSLDDVEKALRIRSGQIDAIERGDMSSLPGRVYAIGFVRTYAEYLEVDEDKVVQLFKAQYMDGQTKADLAFDVPASEAKNPPFVLSIVFLVFVVLFGVVWHRHHAVDRGLIEHVDQVPESLHKHVNDAILHSSFDVEQAVSEEVADAPVENMGSDDPQKSGIILNIIDDCWVEIKNGGGDVIVSNILTKGEQYFVPDSPDLSMSLGNVANVEIVVDGRVLKPLGRDGDVRRDIPLNTAYLKTLEFTDSDASFGKIHE